LIESTTGQDTKKRNLENKLKNILDSLNLPLDVVWIPKANMPIHGEIKENVILIYDAGEKTAIDTFEHEVYEYKFKEVTKLYRVMVNSLIDIIEKEIYSRKETFFDFLPLFQEAMKSLKE